jgi:hypothetical protein
MLIDVFEMLGSLFVKNDIVPAQWGLFGLAYGSGRINLRAQSD